jgi:GNAT superfamily N-acetyltransferase
VAIEEEFRHWHLPAKERLCEVVRPFSHGMVLRHSRYPDFWDYNCIRLDRPMAAGEMIEAADQALADCRHRLAEWTVPIPAEVASELSEHGWMVWPQIYMVHTGPPPTIPALDAELIEIDYDAVHELREIWHREDFGENSDDAGFHAQAREVAALADVRVLAVLEDKRPIGFAQIESRDGSSEIAQVFVHPDRRAAGFGTALTARAISAALETAPRVWICANRDGKPRRLYERLGFRPAVETGVAILPPPPAEMP